MPYSGEKYATAAGPPSVPWYQRGPVRYSVRSRWAASMRRRKSSSEDRAASRPGRSELSIATGSPLDAAQASGSMDSKRATVDGCQDQRRFSIRSCSGASGSGSVTRTVKRRMALTLCDPSSSPYGPTRRPPVSLFHR
jgi:hypothetical protein